MYLKQGIKIIEVYLVWENFDFNGFFFYDLKISIIIYNIYSVNLLGFINDNSILIF